MFEAFVSIFSTRTALSGKPFRSPKKLQPFPSYSEPGKNKTIKYRAFYQV